MGKRIAVTLALCLGVVALGTASAATSKDQLQSFRADVAKRGEVQAGTQEARIHAQIDRFDWARLHGPIVVGRGRIWTPDQAKQVRDIVNRMGGNFGYLFT